MSDSLIQLLLSAIDALDLETSMSLFDPEAELLTVYGRQGNGTEQVRAVLEELIGELRAVHHAISSEWNPEPGVFIAELSATYELNDFSKRGPYRRAIVLRTHDTKIARLRMYGAHELPLPEAEAGYREVRGPHGWLPTL
jgi:ketosteroid isomerase-like protein